MSLPFLETADREGETSPLTTSTWAESLDGGEAPSTETGEGGGSTFLETGLEGGLIFFAALH